MTIGIVAETPCATCAMGTRGAMTTIPSTPRSMKLCSAPTTVGRSGLLIVATSAV